MTSPDADQLDDLFAAWPPRAGPIVRVLYSPPYWDDGPARSRWPDAG
jgi:hypothetical protein